MEMKISVPKDKIDINFKFYLFLKELNGGNGITVKQCGSFLEIAFAFAMRDDNDFKRSVQEMEILVDKIKSPEKKENINSLLYEITNPVEFMVFAFALKLLQIKDLLLEESKIEEIERVVDLSKLHPLSLKYDSVGKYKPYYSRVNGALISLLFFEKIENGETNFISKATEYYLEGLSKDYNFLKGKGIEANQIFMIMFSESLNQSILSSAGSSYEDRIERVLVALGIEKDSIEKVHDKEDSSTEFDFFFEVDGKKYGIGAKRTLRERYKQFIKTAHMGGKLDVMIEITLGIDLTEKKAKSIREHGVILIVADEIYQSREFLQEIEGVFPASELTLDLLKSMANE
jgi:hypothetical protein